MTPLACPVWAEQALAGPSRSAWQGRVLLVALPAGVVAVAGALVVGALALLRRRGRRRGGR